jgi:hypothetical protein
MLRLQTERKFVNAETLTAERVIHWLNKTSRSISNEAQRGTTDMENHGKLAHLCSRYNELKDRAKILGIWDSFCDANGWAIGHDGFDCAA